MSGLHFDADVDTKKFDQGINRIDSELSKIAKQAANSGSIMENAFGKVGNTLDKMGIDIPSLIGPAGALAAAFKLKQLAQDALEFEKAFGMAMREVETVSGAVRANFEGISQEIVDMAANGPDDAIKLAKAYYQIVSAGHDGAAGLTLLSVASKAAVAGVTDTKTAADGLTTVINAWGLSSENANSVADTMFQTVTRGKTTFGELAANIAQVAPLAAANNIEFEQIFAALQTITKQGTPTAQAMTQIRSSIVNMNNVLPDGWAKMMTYQEGLNLVREKAGSSMVALKKLIPDVEGVSAVLALTGKNANGAADDLNQTAKAAGAMEKAYSTMMEEANNKWSVVHNKWTREIRELGKAMKEESGNLAGFMDALLSNGSDVDPKMNIYGIADKIKALRMMGGSLIGSYIKGGLMPESAVREQYDKYIKTIQNYASEGLSKQQMKLGDILGIEDKKERLKQLNDFILSMKDAQQDLGNTVFQNDEQQNSALKIRGELWGEVEARAKEAMKAIEGAGAGSGNAESKGRSLKTMLDELKVSQDSMGTGSLQNDITSLAKISALQKEVTAYYDKIREARKVDPIETIKPLSAKDTIGGVQTITKEQTKQEFQGEKLLKQSKAKTADAIKNADAIKQQNDKYIHQTVLFEGLTKNLHGAGELLGAMSYAVGEFDNTLGQSVGKMADIANNAANMVANFAAGGNPITAIASGIGIIGNVIGLIKLGSSSNQLSSQLAVAGQSEAKNMYALLEKQASLLEKIAGIPYLSLATKQMQDLQAATTVEQQKLKDLFAITGEGENTNDILNRLGINPTDVTAILDAYGKGLISLGNTELEQINTILDKRKQLSQLLQETFREALGFDASNVSDAIFQGIDNGLKLSESGLGGFAKSFGDLMKTAVMQSITDAMNLDITNTFLPAYKEFMADNVLTASERSNLESIYKQLIEKGQVDVNNLKSITDKYGSTSSNTSSSTGVSASASEETVSAMVGQTMALRVDTLTIKNDIKANQEIMQSQLEMMDMGLSALQGIEKNTKNNSVLPEIYDELKEMNRQLKNLG